MLWLIVRGRVVTKWERGSERLKQKGNGCISGPRVVKRCPMLRSLSLGPWVAAPGIWGRWAQAAPSHCSAVSRCASLAPWPSLPSPVHQAVSSHRWAWITLPSSGAQHPELHHTSFVQENFFQEEARNVRVYHSPASCALIPALGWAFCSRLDLGV